MWCRRLLAPPPAVNVLLRAEGRSLIRLPDEGRTEHILRTSRGKIPREVQVPDSLLKRDTERDLLPMAEARRDSGRLVTARWRRPR
ncbi:MAG: hypothetical protein QOF20_2078 [Acidimicrobiaceae bacterium]|nr:hypothetical protein [Acidimicrobiaceae bacterium]